jgi:hypothetical protein
MKFTMKLIVGFVLVAILLVIFNGVANVQYLSCRSTSDKSLWNRATLKIEMPTWIGAVYQGANGRVMLRAYDSNTGLDYTQYFTDVIDAGNVIRFGGESEFRSHVIDKYSLDLRVVNLVNLDLPVFQGQCEKVSSPI